DRSHDRPSEVTHRRRRAQDSRAELRFRHRCTLNPRPASFQAPPNSVPTLQVLPHASYDPPSTIPLTPARTSPAFPPAGAPGRAKAAGYVLVGGRGAGLDRSRRRAADLAVCTCEG